MEQIRCNSEKIICKFRSAEQLMAQGKPVTNIWRAIEVAKPSSWFLAF